MNLVAALINWKCETRSLNTIVCLMCFAVFTTVFTTVLIVGCNRGVVDSSHPTPQSLYDAIFTGRAKDAEKILADHPEVLKEYTEEELDFLGIAYENCPSILPALAKAGMDVDRNGEYVKWSYMFSAIMDADVQRVEWLLKAGADPMSIDGEGNSPYESAIQYTRYHEDKPEEMRQILDLLVKAGAKPITASEINVCPDGTPTVSIKVIDNLIEFSDEEMKQIADGNLLPVSTGAFLDEHPFSKTSNWHFCPSTKEWSRSSSLLKGFKRPFPEAIAKFELPHKDQIEELEYTQIIRNDEVVRYHLYLSPLKLTARDLELLTLASLKKHGINIKTTLLQYNVTKVLDKDWKMDLSVNGDAKSEDCYLNISINKMDF